MFSVLGTDRTDGDGTFTGTGVPQRYHGRTRNVIHINPNLGLRAWKTVLVDLSSRPRTRVFDTPEPVHWTEGTERQRSRRHSHHWSLLGTFRESHHGRCTSYFYLIVVKLIIGNLKPIKRTRVGV